ncbi:MAG: alpha/beta hydrolase family protein [Gaiellaceae bacterium]
MIGAVVALLPASSAAASTSANPSFAALLRLYAYTGSKPLDVRENAVDKERGYTVHDLSYASPIRGRVSAYLVVPDGSGPFPAILWQPGLGGTRSTQLTDAISLAREGAASLLIDSPDVRSGGPNLIACERRDRLPFIQYAVDLRRGVDLLATRPNIDVSRIGDVGFSYGSTIAGVLSGVEHRLKAVVIESGRAYHTGFLRDTCRGDLSKKRMAAYLASMDFSNPFRYVAHAAPTRLLIQNGRLDEFTPRKEALKLQRAASKPKTIRWYAGSHGLTPRAFADRDRFLETTLHFGG